MLLRLEPHILILLLPALIFSLCVHEFSHGLIAYIYGDDTAYKQGRLTLNPIKHLDPTGTIMLLFIGSIILLIISLFLPSLILGTHSINFIYHSK